MALQGTIHGTTSNSLISCKIEWSATQSIDGNYSDVTATLYYSRTNSGYETAGTWSGSITINGEKTSASKYISVTYNSNTAAMSATTRVYHNNDGTKTINIAATGSAPSTSLKESSCTGNVELDTIQRSSSVSLSASNVDVGETITAYITRASTNFTHTVEFYINTDYSQTYSGIATSQTFTIPATWLAYMSSSPSCTAYCKVTTYNGSTQIGNPVERPFTVSVPNTITPSIGTISLSTDNDKNSNILLQNKNTVTVSISGCSAGSGSTIKSYTFSVLSGTTVISTNTVTSSSASASSTFGPFHQTGALKFRVTVTDNREKSVDNSNSEPSLTCHAYNAPSFSSFTAYRCDVNGNVKNDGTYIKYDFGIACSSVNNTNNSTVQIFYKQNSSNSWTTAYNALSNSTSTSAADVIKNTSNSKITFDASYTYTIYATVTDYYGESSDSSKVTVFGQSRIFNVRPNGSGIAFGKMAETNNLFESAWDAKFNGDLECTDLTCTTLNGSTPIVDTSTIVDLIYPVGSIYMSVNATSPATLFGGTWEQLKDRFLLSAGNTYTAGSTGGSADVTLNLNQIPSHAHMEYLNCTYGGGNKTISGQFIIEDVQYVSWTSAERTNMNTGYAGNTSTAGGSQPHNNMPPYLAVYMWKRTA